MFPLDFVNTLEFVDIFKSFDFENFVKENSLENDGKGINCLGNKENGENIFVWLMGSRSCFDTQVSDFRSFGNGSGLGFQNFSGSRISELLRGLKFGDETCYGLDFDLGEEYGVFC